MNNTRLLLTHFPFMCLCLCAAVIFQPNQPRRRRNTDSNMKRWWPRPRREVRSPDSSSPSLPLTRCTAYVLFLPSPLSFPAEMKEAQKRKKQLEDRCKLEESIGTAAQTWNQEILPHWSTVWVPRVFYVQMSVPHTKNEKPSRHISDTESHLYKYTRLVPLEGNCTNTGCQSNAMHRTEI